MYTTDKERPLDLNANHPVAENYMVEITHFDHPATANISTRGLELHTRGPIAAHEVWDIISSTFYSIQKLSPDAVICNPDEDGRCDPGRFESVILDGHNRPIARFSVTVSDEIRPLIQNQESGLNKLSDDSSNYSPADERVLEPEIFPHFIREPVAGASYHLEVDYFDHPATKRAGIKAQTSKAIADPHEAWEAAMTVTNALVGLCPGALVWEADDEVIDPNRFEIPILDAQDRPIAIVNLTRATADGLHASLTEERP
jgi:hypothetical protein